MSEKMFEVKRNGSRFVLVDPVTGAVLDDAQGYGYTSFEKAKKAGWYKFAGGKKKVDTAKKNAAAFWKKNKAFGKRVADYLEINFKEIARGEDDPDVDILAIAQEMGIEGYTKQYLAYLCQ